MWIISFWREQNERAWKKSLAKALENPQRLTGVPDLSVHAYKQAAENQNTHRR